VNAYFKTVFRSIKRSFARFAAIFAIIALGVGFFAGLKQTMPSFLKTGDQFVKDTKLFDLRLLSTIGFDDEDIGKLRNIEGVTTVQGAVSSELMVKVNGNDLYVETVKFHSLTDGVNEPKLTAGRMPSAPNEILADDYKLDESYIGKTLVVSPDNDEDTKELMAYDEYVIVGLIRSPYYLNFQRGNTDVGSGSINYYLYAPIEGFDFEYYSEAYVKLDNDYFLFSDDYDDFIDRITPSIEDKLDTIIVDRFDSFVADKRQELDDAKDEFNTGKTDGEKELEEAAKELEDASKELADARIKLEDSDKELKDARKILDDSGTQLADAKKELDKGKKKLDDGIKEITAAQKEIDSNRAELKTAKDDLDTKIKAVNDGIAQTNAAIAELNYKLEYINNTISTLEATIEELNQAKTAGADVDKELAEASAALETANQNKAQMEAGLTAAQNTLSELDNNLVMLNAGMEEINKNEALIDNAQQTVDASMQELRKGREEYDKGLAKYNDGLAKYNKGEKDYTEGLAKYNDGKKEYEDGLAEYNKGLKEYNDGLEEFNTKIADAQKEIDDAEKELNDLDDPETYVLGRNTNVGYMSFDNDSQIVDGIAKVFPVFFFAIAALVCSTTMSRMVSDERIQIGTMRAMGYSEFAIMMKYVIYSGSAAVSGCIIGYLAGTRVFPFVIWEVYRMMYGFADVVYERSAVVLILSLLVSVLCSVGVTVVTCMSELRGMPSELVRPKAPTAGKRILLEKVTPLWSRMKFLHKVSFRNVFRFKKRMWMMIIGIAGCAGLLLTGFGLTDSINDIVELHYDKIMTYDLSVVFDGMNEEEIRKVSGDAIADTGISCDMAIVQTKSVTHQGTDLLRDVSLIISDDPSITSYVRPREYGTGRELPWPEKGTVAISSKLALRNNLKAGDTITLSYDDDASRMTAKIAYVFENYIFHYAFMSGETYEALTGEDYTPDQAFYKGFSDDMSVVKYAVHLTDKNDVKTWDLSSSLRESFGETVKKMNAVVILIIACAAFLAFIVMFNLNNINITERIREIATLKVMGFNRLETGSYIFRENFILVLIGSLFGIPLGLMLHSFVISQIEMDTVTFVPKILPLSYLWSALFVLAFTLIVDLVMRCKIEKINMAESLKSVE